jgi:O-antigen/teichoic acid export membrane protein
MDHNKMSNTINSNNKRIAKNTIFLYIRMLLLMAVSLYTSRIVLDKLGVSDYGIYNVVGGIVSMLGFLSASMSNAVQRYLSFEIGKGNSEGVNRIFNVALFAHVIIAIIVFVFIEIGGMWYLETYLNVPKGRTVAAIWVLQMSILTTMFTIIQVPYTAIIISKEQMGIYAYLSIIEAVLKLLIVYLLVITPFDRLIFYSILMAAVQILMLLVNRVYCMKKYSEAKFHLIKDWKLLKELVSFAGWNVLGEIAWVFTGQGANMLLNAFFGPVINAARGIADQVNGAVSRFVTNFQVALNPQIIKTYANHDWTETMKLVYRGTRFSFYMLLILSLPIIIEMDKILHIWLKEVPGYTTIFCQLTLMTSIVTCITNLLAQIARAYGKIRNYQIVVSFVLFLNFPLSFLALKLGLSPVSTMIINLLIQVCLIGVRLSLTKKMISFTYKEYATNVFLPIIKVTVAACLLPVFMKLLLNEGVASFILILIITFVCASISSFFLGMNRHERGIVIQVFNKVYNKITNKYE